MEEAIRILCIDDERNVLKSLQRMFLEEDYELITAASGNEGLEILEKVTPIQIVVSDFRMPEMNGVDFLKKVYERWPETVRIVLSGYADAAAIVGAINEGQIYKFIPKPWNDDELKVTISNAVERYYLHQKNMQLAAELKEKNEDLQALNENLERIIEKRTSDLVIQNRVLTLSQNILDSLPVAVLGIGSDSMIVHCNQEGNKLFNGGMKNLIGEDVSSLPEEIKTIVEKVIKKGTHSECITYKGRDIIAEGVFIKHSEGQEGTILVFV
jgi:two-component system NtrC family sensor kinase